jgi:hypothetical protein
LPSRSEASGVRGRKPSPPDARMVLLVWATNVRVHAWFFDNRHLSISISAVPMTRFLFHSLEDGEMAPLRQTLPHRVQLG